MQKQSGWVWVMSNTQFKIRPPCWQGLEYADCIPNRRVRKPFPKKGCHGYDTKLHQIVKCVPLIKSYIYIYLKIVLTSGFILKGIPFFFLWFFPSSTTGRKTTGICTWSTMRDGVTKILVIWLGSDDG